jgi:hypothetical protein
MSPARIHFGRFVLLAALLAAYQLPAFGGLIATTMYDFTGTCNVGDCGGSAGATAQLVLQNYTLGNALASDNFVSFTYDGTDEVAPFVEASLDLVSIEGTLPVNLPAAADVDIFFDTGVEFETAADGTWFVSVLVPSDDGTNGIWAANSAPEPATWMMAGTALAALFFLRRKRAAPAR